MSFKAIIEGMPKTELRSFLESNADVVLEDQVFVRPLTEEELGELEHELGDKSVELEKYARQKKDYLERLGEKTKPLQQRVKAIVESLRTKTEELSGVVYAFKDLENGTIEQFDQEGNFISSRRMRPDENDGAVNVLRMGRRTGTND